MPRDIVKPVFIVGCSRSGTSLLYQRLAMHPDFAFFYKWSRKFPTSMWLSRFASLYVKDPRPKEAGAIWRKFARGRPDDSLGRDDVTPAARTYFQKVLRTQMELFDKPRFLAKHPRNGLRMEYFREIFPDIVFLHIIRDGRATASSILEKRREAGDLHAYWDIKPPGWRDLIGADPVLACGLQWKLTVECIREAGRRLPAGQYVELTYESFTRSPRETLEQLAGPCDIAWRAEDLSRAVEGIRSQNFKWREKLTGEQIRALETAIGPTLQRLGYETG